VRTHDDRCAYLAREAQVRVLSAEYRLAPEDPFPPAVEDAFAAFDFAVRDEDDAFAAKLAACM
jgi:acetyl esterase